MSVLVTGGAGFVGAEVVRSLLRGGHSEVVVFDAAAEPTRLTDIADDVEYIRGDLGDFTHVLDAVSAHKPEVIYHLGGMLSLPCEADPSAAMRVNAMGTFHVLEAAGLFDVRQVLFTSSIGTYGYDMPGDVIDDRTLQRPFYFYGATKLFGEHMGLFYRRKHGIDFRGIRYPSVIGPGVKTPGAVQYTSWMIEESVNGRPFTVDSSRDTRVPVMYYKDAAAAIVQLAGAPAADIKMVSYRGRRYPRSERGRPRGCRCDGPARRQYHVRPRPLPTTGLRPDAEARLAMGRIVRPRRVGVAKHVQRRRDGPRLRRRDSGKLAQVLEVTRRSGRPLAGCNGLAQTRSAAYEGSVGRLCGKRISSHIPSSEGRSTR